MLAKVAIQAAENQEGMGMAKVSKREQARALVVNVLALKVADEVQVMAQVAGRAYLANLEPRESESLALEAVELAARWARSYQASQERARKAEAPGPAPVRLGELAAAPDAEKAQEPRGTVTE